MCLNGHFFYLDTKLHQLFAQLVIPVTDVY